jgi:hypothetical protein
MKVIQNTLVQNKIYRVYCMCVCVCVCVCVYVHTHTHTRCTCSTQDPANMATLADTCMRITDETRLTKFTSTGNVCHMYIFLYASG